MLNLRLIMSELEKKHQSINAFELDKAVETAIKNCNSPDKLPDTSYIDNEGVFHPSKAEQ